MASKLNRKFIFVVGGFSLAAVLLLVAVILVNQLWLKNADRHIRAGDELMAQGKAREAYAMYGRAVGKKPDVVRYIEKMEDMMERYRVFMKRFELSEDFQAKLTVEQLRTQLGQFGMTPETMFQQMHQTLERMKSQLDAPA